MLAVLFGALAGALFGALAVAVPWAVIFSALVIGRRDEALGGRVVAACLLVAAGGALIGAVR